MEMRVGCLVMETARVIVQYATIVMAADIGSIIAAFWDREPGSVSNLFSMTKEDMIGYERNQVNQEPTRNQEVLNFI
jgi:hypothetical protein